ncbi:MAG: ABC-F family ATP-binding cassette domain-containing protein [Tannerellaceae bacterium]|nr:ABC-F family ATP-binding cassette domain-containing protein [Tannerellaceae bacterium]
MVSVENLTVEFGSFTLFDSISFVVNKKDRIALVGRNGAGKSTLLRILSGSFVASSGSVNIPKDISVGYLPQQMELVDKNSVREEAERAFEHIHRMEHEIERINNLLAQRTDYESEDYHKLIEQTIQLAELHKMLGGNNYQAELERTLIGLGFRREDFDRQTAEFSGGWRMRVELAKLLLRKPDVLLLDEPTNHLDIESIQWLETFIATRANAGILVSHDRAFINQTATRTIEIELGRLYDYKVGYDAYVELRRERREQQLRAYENQQKKLADTEAFIERFRYKASKAVQVQSRIKQLEKIERIEVDEVDTSALRLKFPPAPSSGAWPIIMEDVEKIYGNHVVFSNVNLTIKRGEKLGFVGKNGEGKTTLLRCIANEISYTGKIMLGHQVRIAWFAQDEASRLDNNLTVFETIDQAAIGDVRTKIRDILGAFMFGGEASDKKVSVLSGGERSRLAMIRLLLKPANFLILDEPTNHLDMRSKDVLKSALAAFSGTVIVVSHDREFMDGLVEKVYEFANKRVTEHIGGIYEFLERKKISSLRELDASASSTSVVLGETAPSSSKQSYAAQKELVRMIRKHEKALADAEAKISAIEASIASLEADLATPEGAAKADLYARHADLKASLTAEMDEWTRLGDALEELRADT